MTSEQNGRAWLKGHLWREWDDWETDQRRGIPMPPPEKERPTDARVIDLVAPEDLTVGQMPVIDAIRGRRSRRAYSFKGPGLTLEEFSFLLWATQGVRIDPGERKRVFRNVPSAGARHPFETYLLVNKVEGLEPGLYRYLSLKHKLCFLGNPEGLAENIHAACLGQFVLTSAVVFLWAALPYRTEWRYGALSPKLITLDAGHVCQNLYLACEAIGVGTCAIAAYDQESLDTAIGLDGEDEFILYIATVGRVD